MGTPSARDLREKLSQEATLANVPGAAVAVYHDGAEQHAFHGVTSVHDSLPVDEHTIFQLGSITKTYTATAVVRLVERGEVDLHAPVRQYIPELKLRSEEAARDVTVLQLLNHTAGWQGDLLDDTGEGDDAIARRVDLMVTLEQEFPPGKTASYNNMSLVLAGRLIERVTGLTYAQAIRELLLEPLGLDHTFLRPREIMTRRFVVGHLVQPDGSLRVARPWALPRGESPAGGICASVGDLLAWARFALGDGRGPDGAPVLSRDLLTRMRSPSVVTHGGLGDAIGLGWELVDMGAAWAARHGGHTLGQKAELLLVPERDFAVAVLSNASPSGGAVNEELVRWALDAYAGLARPRPEEPVDRPAEGLADYVGSYATLAAQFRITANGGGLRVETEVRPEVLAQIMEDVSGFSVPEPMRLGMITGDAFLVTAGDYEGDRGFFMRNEAGVVDGFHFGGRLAVRA